MTNEAHSTGSAPDVDRRLTLADPAALRGRSGVRFDEETSRHEDREHCGDGVDGRSVVGVANDADQLLLLVNRDLSAALLPHGTVEPGDDWAETARGAVEDQTGIDVELDGVATVRSVEHRVGGEGTPHARTYRVVFRGSPVGGEIRACKRRPGAGSDRWTAGWFDDLPSGVAPPEGGPGDDLRLFR